MAKRKNKDAQDDPIPELETFGTHEQPDPTPPTPDEPEPDGAEYDQLASESDIPDPGLEARRFERKSVRVQTVVQFKESEEDTWKEMVEVTTVSRNGAALMLSRPCPVGRIVSLVMQMPRDLRVYDHHAPVYPMLAIVQNCTSTVVNDLSLYHVGVAFIGKKVPHAYRSNPQQCFRITGISKEGLWEPSACANQFKARKHSRFWRRFRVTVTVRDESRKTSHRQELFTRDVSAGGMAIFGPLKAQIGDRLKITSKDPEFYSMAIVRNRTENPQDQTRSLIHCEFDGGRFPIEKLPMPGKEKEAEPTEEHVEVMSSDESIEFE